MPRIDKQDQKAERMVLNTLCARLLSSFEQKLMSSVLSFFCLIYVLI